MFVLTHTADVVRNSDDPFIGVVLLTTILIIMAVIAVVAVKNMHK